MRNVHSIIISVFVKPGENEEAIKSALLSIIPFDIAKEKLKLQKTVTQGFENKIIIYEIVVEKERHTNAFIDFLKGKLSPEEKGLLASQENRIDEECHFYMRLDKQSLLDGKYELTDSGECFHIKINIAAFPKKREIAVNIVRKIMSS